MSERKISTANIGLNLDNTPSQLKEGELTFALNAVIQGYDGKSVNYQNEGASNECFSFPKGYRVIGRYPLPEFDIVMWWLANPLTGESEIGTSKDCVYTKIINDSCLGHDINHPIRKAVHRQKQVYYTDGYNHRRYIDLDNLPYREQNLDGCNNIITDEVDCNKMNVQPSFSIPQIEITEVEGDGEIPAGTIQFAVQYADSSSNPYTSFFSITNPLSIHDSNKITENFDYVVNKSVSLTISGLDDTGLFDFINIAAIKTVNNISSFDLVGTYNISQGKTQIVYTGQSIGKLSEDDIFERFRVYSTAQDVFTTQGVLGWAGLKETERVNYQSIWSQVKVQWQTWRVKAENGYKDARNTALLKGYMRDEVYALGGVFILRGGRYSDQFPLVGRAATAEDITSIRNDDASPTEDECGFVKDPPQRWQVYNTASRTGIDAENPDECYEGPYEHGEFGYHQSTETYPCDTAIWGELAGQPIRHFHFPDHTITQHHDDHGYIYPIGIKIDPQQIVELINSSSLTDAQKDEIIGFKIVRGNRANNKSIKAKGLLFNVLKYQSKDRVIPTAGSSGEDVDNERPDYAIINNAIDLTHKAKKKEIFGNRNRLETIQEEVGFLKDKPFATQEYADAVDWLIEKTDEYLDNGGNDKAQSYMESVYSMLQALKDISESYRQIQSIEAQFPTDVGQVDDGKIYFPNYLFNDVNGDDNYLDNIEVDDSAKSRYTFHSPDTHFYQPTLGNILKLETIEYGKCVSHFADVLGHAKYQFITSNAYITSLITAALVGFASGQYGVSTQPFDGSAAFTAYRTMLDILFKVTPKRNPAVQLNAVGDYTNSIVIANNGNKQRRIDIGTYLLPGRWAVGDDHPINNFQRESSVYLRTTNPLPFTHEAGGPTDFSKMPPFPDYNTHNSLVSSYYASIKNRFPNQWGQIGSYEVIDTGYQKMIDRTVQTYVPEYVFGGDIFINKFALKRKFPLFIDHRVGAVDESDVFYNEISNVGKAKYWFSTDATKHSGFMSSIFGIRPKKLFWPSFKFFDDSGKFLLFAYGIPYFWVESEVNVDMRQALNGVEGEFYPHVGSGIPDEWLQETRVSINLDNIYHYNKSYSKQNKETFFSTLPLDFEKRNKEEEERNRFRVIFSDKEDKQPRNNWLLYHPLSYSDLPKENGRLISVDPLEDGVVLARFENKSLLYNALTTIDTNRGKAAYLGNDQIFSTPPLDFATTDLGYNGTQHTFLLRTAYGHITVDAKRGQVFLIQGRQAKDLTDASSKVSTFFRRHLPFKILKSFPEMDIDNHFRDFGLHGVFNNKRFILTKRDYVPLHPDITYSSNGFLLNGSAVTVDDRQYFCNQSFTISFDFDTGRWVSFHSYVPHFYVGKDDHFYAGLNEEGASCWLHQDNYQSYNRFFGKVHPYILEYPLAYQVKDEILQSVQDFTKVYKHTSEHSYTYPADVYFNKAIIYNDEQCSGLLELIAKPLKDLKALRSYPKYKEDSKEILFTKSDNLYSYNTFWDIVVDNSQPVFLDSCSYLDKELNTANLDYSNKVFRKAPIRGKDVRIRHILDNKTDYRFVSQFVMTENQISYK